LTRNLKKNVVRLWIRWDRGHKGILGVAFHRFVMGHDIFQLGSRCNNRVSKCPTLGLHFSNDTTYADCSWKIWVGRTSARGPPPSQLPTRQGNNPKLPTMG
jgi:hypothetical protein